MKNQIKKEGILINLIGAFNSLEKELKGITLEYSLNYLEYSILLYIAEHCPTQYRISKEYFISIQRVNQIVKKLMEKNYVLFIEEQVDGRIRKKIMIELKTHKNLDSSNSKLVENLKKKSIEKNDLKMLNKYLKNLLIKLS